MTNERRKEIEETVKEWKAEAERGEYGDPGFCYKVHASEATTMIEELLEALDSEDEKEMAKRRWRLKTKGN